MQYTRRRRHRHRQNRWPVFSHLIRLFISVRSTRAGRSFASRPTPKRANARRVQRADGRADEQIIKQKPIDRFALESIPSSQMRLQLRFFAAAWPLRLSNRRHTYAQPFALPRRQIARDFYCFSFNSFFSLRRSMCVRLRYPRSLPRRGREFSRCLQTEAIASKKKKKIRSHSVFMTLFTHAEK